MPQKPVECMRRPILNNSSPGQAVYEPFMGSGTTLIAAETTGRVCLGIELNPAYVDVAVERWQRFTGQAGTMPRPRSLDTGSMVFAMTWVLDCANLLGTEIDGGVPSRLKTSNGPVKSSCVIPGKITKPSAAFTNITLRA